MLVKPGRIRVLAARHSFCFGHLLGDLAPPEIKIVPGDEDLPRLEALVLREGLQLVQHDPRDVKAIKAEEAEDQHRDRVARGPRRARRRGAVSITLGYHAVGRWGSVP